MASLQSFSDSQFISSSTSDWRCRCCNHLASLSSRHLTRPKRTTFRSSEASICRPSHRCFPAWDTVLRFPQISLSSVDVSTSYRLTSVALRSAKNTLPAYSLAMPLGRMYIINSPDLVMAVQRNAKTLNSAPFAAKYAARVVNVSKETEVIWFHNVDGEDGEGSLFVDGMKAMQASLTPGNSELDHIVNVMLNSFLKPCKALDDEPQKRKLWLMVWLRDELTLAATDAIYGAMNPFEDRHVRNCFW